MVNTQRSGAVRNSTARLNTLPALTTIMLLVGSMILAACGGSSEPVVESTAVPTLAAPAATPAATEAAATPEVSDSETTTDTQEAGAGEAMTDTEEAGAGEEMTGTDEAGTTETMTDTEEAGATETTTDTEEAGAGEAMTDTEGVGDSEAMTDTEGVGDSDEMTDTEDIDDSGEMTGTGAVDSTADEAMMGVSGVESHQYVRASTLLDYDFENLDGEVSGDLEDLLIDLSTGRVLFASIEYGGVLDLGDKDIVVPLNAFAIGEEGELVLNIDETALENYPDVGNDWPDLNDPAWDDDVNTYWSDTGVAVGPGFEEGTTSVAWASDLMGHNVADLGAGAGSVLDILVNLGTGRAPYVIVDYGEGLDTDPYIIPFAAFDVTDWSNELVYGPDFTPDILENAPRFDQDTYPEGTPLDQTFGESIESAWNDLGFSNDLNNDGDVD